jgi:hypothetical protein
MKLYLHYNNGNMGSVFHLDDECGQVPDTITYEVSSTDEMRHFRDVFGIRRICLKCRKTVSKSKGR